MDKGWNILFCHSVVLPGRLLHVRAAKKSDLSCFANCEIFSHDVLSFEFLFSEVCCFLLHATMVCSVCFCLCVVRVLLVSFVKLRAVFFFFFRFFRTCCRNAVSLMLKNKCSTFFLVTHSLRTVFTTKYCSFNAYIIVAIC